MIITICNTGITPTEGQKWPNSALWYFGVMVLEQLRYVSQQGFSKLSMKIQHIKTLSTFSYTCAFPSLISQLPHANLPV